MCTPSPGLDHPVYNDFNRKDLFTQHLRRMHSPAQQEAAKSGQAIPPGSPSLAGSQLSDDEVAAIQKRCYRILRNAPPQSSCIFCNRVFSGPNSWEERLEHVGGHLERDRKNGTGCGDVGNWREDADLRDYLLKEGIVELDARGAWRIGDGRPRRNTAPSADGAGTDSPSQQQGSPHPGSQSGIGDVDSEGSMSKRRRGRPPKKYPGGESPIRLAPNAMQSQQTPRSSGTSEGQPKTPTHHLPEPIHQQQQQHLSDQRHPPQLHPIHQLQVHNMQPSGPPMLQPRPSQQQVMEHHQHQQSPAQPMTPTRLDGYNALQIQTGPPQGLPHTPLTPHQPQTPQHDLSSQPPSGSRHLPQLMPRTPQQAILPQQPSPFGPSPGQHSQMQLPPPQHHQQQQSTPGLVSIAPAPPSSQPYQASQAMMTANAAQQSMQQVQGGEGEQSGQRGRSFREVVM
jgi:hypothetical protein